MKHYTEYKVSRLLRSAGVTSIEEDELVDILFSIVNKETVEDSITRVMCETLIAELKWNILIKYMKD